MPEYEALESRFEGLNAQVLGVSVDSVPSNTAWANSLGGITYPLLSDFWPHGAVASAYGVFDDDTGGARRSSYLIDQNGVVRWSVHNPSGQPRDLDTHAEAVKRLLEDSDSAS